MTARALDAAWPAVLFLLFAASFQRLPRSASAGASDCESIAPTDVSRLQRCVSIDPADVQHVADLARAYRSAGHLDAAEAACRRALTLDPIDGDLHLLLASILIERGDAGAARTEADLALRRLPGSRAAAAILARASDSRLEAGR